MAGIDLLISYYLSSEIKNNFKKDLLKKIEHDLFFEEGMSIKLSIEHFEKFYKYLKKYTSFDLDEFEKVYLKKIIKAKKIKDGYNVKIISQLLAKKIFDYFGNDESRAILMSIMGATKTIPEILKDTKLLKSPVYRKIENLLIDGLIFESGKFLKDKKRVSRYSCIFDEVNISIKQKKFLVECIVSTTNFNNSSIVKIGLFEN